MEKSIPKIYTNEYRAKVSIRRQRPEKRKWRYHDKRYWEVLTVVSVYVPNNCFEINEAKIGRINGRDKQFCNHYQMF